VCTEESATLWDKVLAAFGLVAVLVGWVLELLLLDIVAVGLFGGGLLCRALLNLLGSGIGLFGFAWMFRIAIGCWLGVGGESPSARLKRLFKLPWRNGENKPDTST
jgi:hypothetical protein